MDAQAQTTGIINKARDLGISPDDARYPIVQMERWVHTETAHGIAAGTPVPLKGAVVLRVTLLEGEEPENAKASHQILVRA